MSILGSGDVLIHPPLITQAAADAKAAGETGYDFSQIYASIKPVTSSVDLATCELETPLARRTVRSPATRRSALPRRC